MVAAYTTRIRLTKQGEGDNDSTWGTVLNDEVIDLTDFAIAGYTTVNLASGDVTLTSNDGAPDQSRSAMLELTGTLTGNRNVYIPGVSKSYVVRNNTSGAYSATVKVTGGTGYAIQQGESNLIYCDAVSVREVSSPLVTQFTSISSTIITGVNVSVTGYIKAASVSTSGNIHAAGEIASQSDERLKSNIKIISGAVDKVKNLKGITFTFKADDRPSTGLLAQDVQNVMPEAITQNGDYLYVSYGNLLGLIVEAIKEIDQKITSKNCVCGK